MSVLLVGVAIATYNAQDHLRECLLSLVESECANYELYIVVVDDSSTDGTREMLECEFPEVQCVAGDGNLWWTGGTNEAIRACLRRGCDYVLVLNPDCIVEEKSLLSLLAASKQEPDSVLASVVLDYDKPETVWWAGSVWGPLFNGLPIYTSRYLYKAGDFSSTIADRLYPTSEAHGRGVLVPRSVFAAIGLYDEKSLPHYGADFEFCLRAHAVGISIFVVPQSRVRLHTKHTGMTSTYSWRASFTGYRARLWKRKNGESIHVWWCILRRHLPLHEAIPSYAFIITLNTVRYWQSIFRSRV